MALGSYQDPGEEIGGSSSSSSSSSSSRSSPNPSQPTGGSYVASTPSSGNYSGTGGTSYSGSSGASSSRSSSYNDAQGAPDYSSYAGQGYVSNTPSAASRSTSYNDAGGFNPSMPTGGAYVATTPTGGNYSGGQGGGASYGFMPVGGGLMPSPSISLTPTGGAAMTARGSRLMSVPGYNEMFPNSVPTTTLGPNSTLAELETYIRDAAIARGIDPDVAVRAAKTEGLNTLTKASEGWQSTSKKNGEREPSYSPFQLLVGEGSKNYGPGLGDEFIAKTGLDPSDPKNVQATIDFALDYAAQNGWGSWYGPAKAGIGSQDGLTNAQPIGINAPVAQGNAATPGAMLANMYGAPTPASRPAPTDPLAVNSLAFDTPEGLPSGSFLTSPGGVVGPVTPAGVNLASASPVERFGLVYLNGPAQALKSPEMTAILNDVANLYGRDLSIQSGYRGPNHPIEEAKKAPGEHSRTAADINMGGMSDKERKDLVVDLRERGVNRFIVYTDMPDVLHVDLKDQRGDGSAYFMVDKTAQNNAISRAPQWYRDAAKEAKGVKVAGVSGSPSTMRVASASPTAAMAIPTPASRPVTVAASTPSRVAPGSGNIPPITRSPMATATIPTPADRPTRTAAVGTPVTAPTAPASSEAPKSFREKYLTGGNIASTAIDIGVGLLPGIGTPASLFNAGASIMGKPTIGQRIVANAGNGDWGSPNLDGFPSMDDTNPSYPRYASRWSQDSTERDPAKDFEETYIQPTLYESDDWQTPTEKWG